MSQLTLDTLPKEFNEIPQLEGGLPFLPADILRHMLDFMPPSAYYIVTTYFKCFRLNEKRIFPKGVIGTDACQYDNVFFINLFYNDKIYTDCKITRIAALHGCFNVLKLLLDIAETGKILSVVKSDKMIFANACANGNIEILQWLKENNFETDQTVGIEAASRNKSDIIIWLLQNGYKLADRVWSLMIQHGNLELLKYGKEKGYTFVSNFCHFCPTNRPDILKWLYEQRIDHEDSNFHIGRWDLETIKWLHARGYQWQEFTAADIIKSDQLESLNYVYDHGCVLSEYCYEEAARKGNKEIFQWLYDHNCPKSNRTTRLLARRGNLELLKWCCERYFPFDELTMYGAIRNAACDNFSITSKYLINWLRDKGCRWDYMSFAAAIKSNNKELINFVHENGCSMTTDTIDTAIRINQLETVKWLRDKGCPWDESIITTACFIDNLTMVMWLHEHGCPWDDSAICGACKNLNVELIKYLKINGCPINFNNYAPFLKHEYNLATIHDDSSNEMSPNDGLKLVKIMNIMEYLHQN